MWRRRKKKKMEKKQIKITINSELPSHILHLIFSKLPVFNLPSCRIVCKAWNNLISTTCKFHNYHNSELFFTQNPAYENHVHCMNLDDIYLKEMNTTVASFIFHLKCPKFQIANSCNGLLCIVTPTRIHNPCVAILNPATNEFIGLPKQVSNRDYLYGLGFSPKTKQYKIARHSIQTAESCENGVATVVEIFAFGGTSGGRGKWTPVASGSLLQWSDLLVWIITSSTKQVRVAFGCRR